MPDDRVVMALHPSPMLIRRRRARLRERCLAATRTPVVVRRGCRDDLGEAHAVSVGDATLVWRVYEGALWYQVAGTGPRGHGRPTGDPFGPAVLAAFLAGGPAARDLRGTDLDLALRRTPLVAVPVGGGQATRGAAIEGWDGHGDAIEVAEILDDGRGAASEGLARFVGERVRVVGDLVLIRSYDPLVRSGPRGAAWQPFPQARDLSLRAARHRGPLGYRPDAHAAGMAWEAGSRPGGAVAGASAGPLSSAPYGPDTARLVAGFAATVALGAFVELRDRYGHCLAAAADAGGPAIPDGWVGEALRWAGMAAIGSVAAAEAPLAVDAARRLSGAVSACYGDRAAVVPMAVEAVGLVRRFEEYEWPLGRPDGPVADDMRSLGALGR